MIKAAPGITYKLRHSDNLHQSIPMSAHAQMSEQVKGFFFFLRAFSPASNVYTLYTTETLITYKLKHSGKFEELE